MTDPIIAGLIDRLLKGTITPDEKVQLAQWIEQNPDGAQWKHLLEGAWSSYVPEQSLPSGKAASMLESIRAKAREAEAGAGPGAGEAGRMEPGLRELRGVGQVEGAGPVGVAAVVGNRRRIGWRRLAAAAVAGIVLLAGGYYLLPKRVVVKTAVVVAALPDVQAPASSNAVLTLANGRQIVLDSAGNGSLCMQGKTSIVKKGDGEIVYQGQGKVESLEYNTLTVPRGSRIAHILLSDGTKVWLNAGSSLKYPVAFTGPERRVWVTGETYFEVTADAHAPFIVNRGDHTIRVLGTHFNVHAWEDDADEQITLLEGKVEVGTAAGKVLLRPGQMARIAGDGPVRVENRENAEDAIAWKNGRFQFSGADIRSVMQELARWYGLELTYKEPVTEKFHLELDRNSNVSNVLKILETTGGVHFLVEGNKVTIMR